MKVICPYCASSFGDDDPGKVYKCRHCGEFFQVGEEAQTQDNAESKAKDFQNESYSLPTGRPAELDANLCNDPTKTFIKPKSDDNVFPTSPDQYPNCQLDLSKATISEADSSSKTTSTFNSIIERMKDSEKKGSYSQVLQLCDELSNNFSDLPDLNQRLFLKSVRGRALIKTDQFEEAKHIFGELLEYDIEHNLPVASSTHMYRWLCAYYDGDEQRAMHEHINLTDDRKAISLLRTPGSSDNTSFERKTENIEVKIDQIKKFIHILKEGGVCPFDNEQGVIDEVARSCDSTVLPILREAVSASIDYQNRAIMERDRVGHHTLRSGELDTLRMAAKNMETRLRKAIEMCTPPGEAPVFESKRNFIVYLMFKKILSFYTKYFAVWVVVFGIVAYLWPGPFVGLKSYMNWFFALTMFGIGAVLEVADFRRIVQRPTIVLIGSAAQFSIMPLGAFLLAKYFV
jgi:hypothetical protein